MGYSLGRSGAPRRELERDLPTGIGGTAVHRARPSPRGPTVDEQIHCFVLDVTHLEERTLCGMLEPPADPERLVRPAQMLNTQRRRTPLGALTDMTPAGVSFLVVPRNDTLVLEIGVEFFVEDRAVDRREGGMIVRERGGRQD